MPTPTVWEVVLDRRWNTDEDSMRRTVRVVIEEDDGERESLEVVDGPKDLVAGMRFDPESKDFETDAASDWFVVSAKPLRSRNGTSLKTRLLAIGSR